MMRRSERRFVVITRSRRAPTSCRNSAVLSSLSLLSGRAIRTSAGISGDRFLLLFAVVLDFRKFVQLSADVRKFTILRRLIFLEADNRPLPIGRRGMPECGKKSRVVVRIGVAPALTEVDIALGRILCAPHSLLIGRHHRRRQPASRKTAAVHESICREV